VEKGLNAPYTQIPDFDPLNELLAMAHIPLIRTKLHRPPVAAIHVQRPQLMDQLNQQLPRPLTLVSAPAGYGKSTLVSSWVESCDLPVAWLSAEETENDLQDFLAYFLAAAQTIFPEVGLELQAILRVGNLPPQSVLAAYLINELDEIDQTFFLVIDDFHFIQNRAIHELLEAVLRHPPRAMHLVLVSRKDPSLSLATLRARGQLTEIRMRDLRFSRNETSEFLQQMLETEIEESLAATFEEKTEGWITGLHLAALSLRNRKDLESVITELPDNNRFVVEYLAAEILLGQPAAIQECLLKTSILGRFCAPLCDALCNSDGISGAYEVDGQTFMQQLTTGNLFMISLDNENHWFRYHHLFRDLLKRRLEQRYKPEEIEQLHANASTWFSENGNVEEALQHAIESGDLESAPRLVAHHRHDIMNSEQWHRLECWLNMMPADTVENNPDVIILKAWICEIWMRLEELRTYLKQVEPHFSSKPSSDTDQWKSLRAEYHTLSALLHYIDGDGEQVVDLSRKALQHLVPQAQSPRSLAQCMLSFGHQMRGDLTGAYDVLYEAIKQSGPGQTTYQSRLYLALSLLHWIAADLNGMHTAAGRVLVLNQDTKLPESVGIAHHLVGIFYYLQNDLAEADKNLGAVVNTFYESNLLNFAHSAFAMALSCEAQGKPEEAQALAEVAINKALDSKSSEFMHLAEAFQAELFLRQGQVAKAQTWAVNYNPRPFDPGYRFYVPQMTYVKALLAGKTSESLQHAVNLLSDLHDHYSAVHNTRYLIDVLILQVLLCHQQGQESSAFEELNKALALAEPGGFIRPFLDLGRPMADLMKRFMAQKPDQEYAKQILAAFYAEKTGEEQDFSDDQSAAPPAISNQALLEPLTSREIQILKVLSQGRSNQEIAETLFISPETVKRHLYNIFQKFDVKNRQQAIARATSLGLV
jgi:LuxR family maltose regulon positive regulatory protein